MGRPSFDRGDGGCVRPWRLTSVLSNTAAAVLVFPVALRAAQASGVAVEPLAMAMAKMVQGPGGYRLGDYLRFGGPLTVICGVVAVTVLAAWYY